MECLVTGGCGFIGSHLVDKLLEEGHAVTVIDNLSTGRVKNIEEHWENPLFSLQVEDIVKCFSIYYDFDWIFHLAGLADIVPSIERPLDYFKTNVTGTVNVLELARKIKAKRFIYAASSSCYGISPIHPTSEHIPVNPQYPYALTKYLGEECIKHWGKVYKVPWVSLRLFNVYGPRSRTTGAYGAVFGVFLKQKLEGMPFTVVGDGNQKRDFIYVSDVVDTFVKAAESKVQGIYNVGSGNPQSINKLVELLEGEVVHIPERPRESGITHADISKIKSHLKWEPKVSFEEGVKLILEHIEDWKDAPLWTPEKIEEATKVWFQTLN